MPGVKGRSGGQNRKAIADLRLNGTFRPDRHGGVTNLDAPAGDPVPPPDLQGEARVEWDRTISRLRAMQTLSVVDDAIVGAYCRVHQQLVRLARDCGELKSPTIVVSARHGKRTVQQLRTHPTIREFRAFTALTRVLLAELGLTPASRVRVRVPASATAAEDPFAEFDQPLPTRAPGLS